MIQDFIIIQNNMNAILILLIILLNVNQLVNIIKQSSLLTTVPCYWRYPTHFVLICIKILNEYADILMDKTSTSH